MDGDGDGGAWMIESGNWKSVRVRARVKKNTEFLPKYAGPMRQTRLLGLFLCLCR